MTRRKAGSVSGTIVRSLHPIEHVGLVAALLADRPELTEVVEGLAADLLRDVDRQVVSREVVDTNLNVEFTEIGARMGRVPGGYVDEHEARWLMLEELLDPFLEDRVEGEWGRWR